MEDAHIRFWERTWSECRPRLLGGLPQVEEGSAKASQSLLTEVERSERRLAHAPDAALRQAIGSLCRQLREAAGAAQGGDLNRAKRAAAAARQTVQRLEDTLAGMT